jgi:hypothetical protein
MFSWKLLPSTEILQNELNTPVGEQKKGRGKEGKRG